MQARTWILLGVLAGTAVAVRHTSHADEVVPDVAAPRHEAAAPREDHVGFQPMPAPPAVAPPSLAPRVVELRAALAQLIEDGPVMEATGESHAVVGGNVRDLASGEGLAGVTVIATSPALEGTQTAITDEDGDYAIAELPPGEYLLTFYYADITMERPSIVLEAGSALHFPLVLDPDEHPRDVALSQPINIPVPGRTFEDALGGAAGSQCDCISFTGVTSLENTYIVLDE